MYSYIHIPFCNSKCKYCRFASLGKTQDILIKKYLGFLLKEISKFNGKKEKLETIYFGGGTPSTFTPSDLEKIILTLKNKFGLKKNIEITLETTPDNVNLENLISWEKIGINRVSIGIQTLNNKSLKEINRGDNQIIFSALSEIKNYINKPLLATKKISNFSLDFIIGLPYVKLGETKKDIELIFKKYNFIKHISVYLLEDYYKVEEKIEEKNNFEKITYPDCWNKNGILEEDYLGEYLEIKKFLEKNLFNSYEVSNYSKKGFECKHNIGYWKHKETLAFGLSASGLIKNTNGELFRYSNSANFIEYYAGKNIEKNILTENDIFLEKVMFGLRTNGLEENIFKKLNSKKIQEFLKLDFLKIKKISGKNKLILKDKGVLVLDYIIREII